MPIKRFQRTSSPAPKQTQRAFLDTNAANVKPEHPADRNADAPRSSRRLEVVPNNRSNGPERSSDPPVGGERSHRTPSGRLDPRGTTLALRLRHIE
jgi:hypothetical protein